MGSMEWNIIWSLCFGLLAAAVISGNIVTITIFLKRRHRKRAHFLLISLAVADLLVGLLAIPLYISLQYVFDNFEDDLIIVAVTDFTDMFTGFTSIFTLATISLERMYAVGWPFRHRIQGSRFYIFVISVPWILSLVAASTEIVLQYVLVRSLTFTFILIVSMFTPIIITCTAYFFLWKKEKSRASVSQQNHQLQDRKLAKTVALITGAFLLTWLPLQILLVAINFCISCRQPPTVVRHFMKLLQYGNSAVNVVMYAVRDKDYRRTFGAMISSLNCPRQSYHEVPTVVTLTTFADFNANTPESFQQTKEVSAIEDEGILTPR